MRESDLYSVFIEIGTPSALGVRRDKRESVLEHYCKHPISGWLECAYDIWSNDENLLSIGLPKLILQSQGITPFLSR